MQSPLSPLVTLLALGCATATTPLLPPATAPAPDPSVTENATILPLLATGCWMPRDANEAPARDRCTEVLLRAWGTADEEHRARLEALDPDEVGALRARLAERGVDAVRLARMDRIALVRREAVVAQRAAVSDALGRTTATAVPCDAWLDAFANTYDPQLRTIVLVTALERMDRMRDLPFAIRARSLGPILAALADTTAPDDPTPMQWLAFLEAVAGYVPRESDLETREARAWQAVRVILAQRIVESAEPLPASDDLRSAAMNAAARTDAQTIPYPKIPDGARDAHAIVLQAAACWLDPGLESTGCAIATRTLHRDRTSAYMSLDAMRWAEPTAVDEVLDAVRLAGGPNVEHELALVRIIARAAREGASVRRATGDAMFADAAGESKDLQGLLAVDTSVDARAVGLAFAAERLWAGQDERLVARMTGQRMPLSRLEEDFDSQPSFARAAVGEGVAERLRLLPVGAPLTDVIGSIVLRLDIDYRAALARYEP